MVLALILLCLAVIVICIPPASPQGWFATLCALVALLIAATGWNPLH